MQVIAIVLCLFLVVQLQRGIYQRLWNRNLEAEVHFQKRSMLENELVKVNVTVRNRKNLPLPALSVIFTMPRQFAEVRSKQKDQTDTYHRNELFTLYSYQSITRTLTFRCKQRGCYTLDEMMLQSRSLFMDREDSEILPLKEQLIVYPRCVNMRNFVKNFQNLFGEILTNDFMNEDVFLIRNIRKYQPFDSRRSINWKATAKAGALMVNNYEYTSSRKVTVFLHLTQQQLEEEPEIGEEAIRLAKTWCWNLSRYGIESDLYTNGQEQAGGPCLLVEAKKTVRKYMNHVDEALARIVCCQEEENFFTLYQREMDAQRRDRFFVIISSEWRDAFQNGLLRLKEQNGQFVWIIPKKGRSSYHLKPGLKNQAIGWNIYWRREENFETINL